jgi:tetratricopeptide (TPR) repeat protein
VDAWQLAMGALALMETREREACERSLAMAQAALEQDPDCLIAAYTLALGHYQRLSFQWTTDPFASASALAEHAALCKRIAPDDPYSYIADGTACMLRADIDGAIAELTRAIERNPSAARAHSFLGQLRGMKGDPDGGIESLERAMLLSPRDTQLWSMLAAVGVCHFAADRLEQCSHYLHRAADRKGDEPLIWAILAAAAGLAGWQEEAELALAELFRVQPNFTLEGFRRVGAAILPAYLEKFEAGLRRAGYVDPA